MQLLKIDSSIIKFVAYDKAKKALLTVFVSNKAYIYYGVPLNIYQEFLSNSSQGSYHKKFIQKFYEYDIVTFNADKKVNHINTRIGEFMVREQKITKADIRKQLLMKKMKGNRKEIEKKVNDMPENYINNLLTLNYDI